MKQSRPSGTKFLGKYINKKKLGKGAFGDVFLVEDQKGELMALKMIDKKKLQGQNQDMLEYLQGEIICMKKMTGKNMVQLYNVQSDDDFYYMLLEYCDGGDLVNLQAMEKKKVFSLQTATEYLSQVIKGFEQLHKAGYLHRDIKPQNVLLKNEDGQKVFKIADFGFAKKASNLTGTVLGTEQYMSPQIYHCGAEGVENQGQQQIYGYEVDMWAFGVLFFYMLNQDFPFKINPYWSLQEKARELTKQATDFSYRKAVMKTRRKIEENCTDEVEDLFKKIFQVYTNKRITFAQIRQHQVFRKHFPKASQASQILYHNKFQSTRLKKKESFKTNKLQNKLKQLKKKTTISVSAISNPEQKQFITENETVKRQFQEVDFLWHIYGDFAYLEGKIDETIIVMVSYNIVKYYLILLKKFNIALMDHKNFSVKYKKDNKDQVLQWKAYWNHPDLLNKKNQYAKRQATAQARFQELYHKCSFKMEEIQKINSYFKQSFKGEVQDNDQSDQNFYRSYRQSTNILYSSIRQVLKTTKTKELYFLLCAICICHVFNDLMDFPSKKEVVFDVYVEKKNVKGEMFSYENFIDYLKRSSKEVLVQQAYQIIEQCMM